MKMSNFIRWIKDFNYLCRLDKLNQRMVFNSGFYQPNSAIRVLRKLIYQEDKIYLPDSELSTG